MKTRRKLLYALAAVLGCLILAALCLYLQAARVPEGYQPRQLSATERDEAMRDFARRCQELYNNVQRRRAFEWRISEQRLNEYLASVDEIASGLPGGILPGQVSQAMRRAGVADLAAELGDDGRITLMARLIRWGKVVSVSLAIEFPEPGIMRVRFLGARIGRLSLPETVAQDALAQLKAAVREYVPVGRMSLTPGEDSAQPVGPSSDDMARLLATVLLAVNEQPISTSLQIDRKEIRIADLRVTDDSIALLVEPEGLPLPQRRREEEEGWPAEFNLPRRE